MTSVVDYFGRPLLCFFQKVLSLCMDSILERFLIKSGLYVNQFSRLCYCFLFTLFNYILEIARLLGSHILSCQKRKKRLIDINRKNVSPMTITPCDHNYDAKRIANNVRRTNFACREA